LFKAVLVFAFSATACVAATNADELKTYEFVPGQSQLFHLRGGLGGADVSAQLSGTFDIQLENDGTATLSRFDVQLIDVLNHSSIAPTLTEGQSLAEILFKNPVGLTGNYDPTATHLNLFPPNLNIAELLTWGTGPITSVTMTATSGPLSTVQIASSLVGWLDTPDFFTDSPGFLVRLVPEPTSSGIAFCGALAAMFKPRRKRPAA
jgi:hypothetical protein